MVDFRVIVLGLILVCVVGSNLGVENEVLMDAITMVGSLLDSLRKEHKYLHIVEFGGSQFTGKFGRHDAVLSWSVIAHDPLMASKLREEWSGSGRVGIKAVYGDFTNTGEKIFDRVEEEGTLQEFESYIQEMKFFAEREGGRGNAYWVINGGRARVDVGIAALPLLSRTGGKMVITDWDRTCYDTLNQFYEVEKVKGNVAVLKPKGKEELSKVQAAGTYDWCFSFKGRSKTLRVPNGPLDTRGCMDTLSSHVGGCKDMGETFYCDNDENGKKGNCLSCFDALMAITKRGFWLQEGLVKSIDAGGGGGGEL